MMRRLEYDDNDIATGSGLLRSRVFRQIENDIISGKYKLGDSLTEKELSDQMGVSRTPVREAFRQLELEGLVQSIPNKGVIVTGIAQQDIEDIYSIKIAIEGLAARLAAERISAQDLADLEEIVDLMEFYVGKNDIQRLLQLDSRFHEIIFMASKNRPLMLMLTNFHNYVQRARNESLATPGRAKNTLAEHKLILEAIKNGDPNKAEELTKLHVQNTMNNLHSLG